MNGPAVLGRGLTELRAVLILQATGRDSEPRAPYRGQMSRLRSVVVASVFALLLPPAVAAPVNAADSSAPATVAKQGSHSCDWRGDRKRADDCVTHTLAGRAGDGVVAAGKTFRVRMRGHDALNGLRVSARVQVRKIGRDATFVGDWKRVRMVSWSAADKRTVVVRAPRSRASYTIRVKALIPSAKGSMRSRAFGTGVASAGAISATSAPTILSTEGCPNGPDAETMIEYFNQIEFEEDIYLLIYDGDVPAPSGADATTPQGTFAIQLSCPPQVTPYFPPADFQISLSTGDGTESVTCNDDLITLKKAQMSELAYCEDSGTDCTFVVVASDKATGGVFSTTELMVTFFAGNNTYIPDLQPATLPLCPETFDPCVLTGDCALSDERDAMGGV